MAPHHYAVLRDPIIHQLVWGGRHSLQCSREDLNGWRHQPHQHRECSNVPLLVVTLVTELAASETKVGAETLG
jgi:hypothetical protein